MIRSSIRRPVAVTMVYVSVALLGIAAWRNIGIELLPDVSFPQLTLVFSWPGSSPETVEAFATSPVESAIQQVEGVEEISSTTREGRARITVSFARDVDMEFARLDLTDRLATVEEELPDGVSPIQIQPYVPREFEEEANRPFLSYSYTGPFLIEALRRHLDEVVAPEILRIRGVSEVEVEGGRARLLEIELDPDRIAALGLRPDEVREAVEALDLVREAGAVREGMTEWAVTIRTRPTSAADLRAAILPVAPDADEHAVRGGPPGGLREFGSALVSSASGSPARGHVVRLEDVARVRDTFEEPRFHFRVDGSPAIGFEIHKEYGTNTVRLAESVKARIAELESLNLPGSRFILQDDQSEEIRAQLTDLRTRALIAAGVIFLVLLGFFRSYRMAGVVFATIAFSVLISLNLIYFAGLTLNILTLMGLALGFGLVVDNSIVVLENIVRKRQDGLEAPAAAEKGAREVVLPILASTLTTLIVFLPFLYLQGELRIYYVPLAVVVGLTLVASIFVAFTFIPALAARVLRGSPNSSRGFRSPACIRLYSALLKYMLRFPWITVGVAVVCFGASAHLFDRYVRRGRIWGGAGGARGSWVDIRIQMPRGSDLERVDELTRSFEDRLARMPEVGRFMSWVQRTSSYIRVDFPVDLELTAVPLVVEEQLRAYSRKFTGAEVRVVGRGPTFYGGAGSAPNYRITILGYNYDRLAEIAEDLGSRLQGHSRIREVDTNASELFARDRAVEFVAEIDREAAARHGISAAEVVNAVGAHLREGGRTGQVMMGGEAVSFQVRLEDFQQADVDDLRETVIATSAGGRVRLGDLIEVREREVLTSIRRENQQYGRMVAYEFRGPRALGDVIRDGALAATVLPPGYSLEERTPWRISGEDARQMIVVLLVALGLIYMVTAGLFESLRQPLCVLLAVPMALVGVFLIFVRVEATFTREAYIGVIMMGGIVVNNAILLIDCINRVRREGSEGEASPDSVEAPADGSGEERLQWLKGAIVEGNLERVRPILMTTATTVFGLLPLVLFMPAADATIWNALTYALIGGLLASTLFVLTVTPALYFLFERGWGMKKRAWRRTGMTLVLLTCSVVGCSGDARQRRLITQVEASDSAGVSRVRILDLFELGIPGVVARRAWRANVSELNDVRDAWIDPDGSVLLANGGNAEVIRLSPAGEAIARFGSPGEGPGDFAQFGLNWIEGSREGRIVTYDERLARVTEFTPDGAVLKTHRVASPAYRVSLQPVTLLSGRRILATYGDLHLRRSEREGVARDTLPLLSISFGEAADSLASEPAMSVDTLGRWPGLERMDSRTTVGMASLPIGFANDVLYDGAGSVAAVSPSEEMNVRVFEDGQLSVTVEATPPPRPVREEDARAVREDLRGRAPDPSLEELWSEAPVNEIYPTLDRLLVTQEGNVWVGIQPEYREEKRTFILLDRQGFPVGRLRLPRELEILGVAGDRIVISTRTELDEERIELWRIE